MPKNKSKKNHYFTQVHEEAIQRYIHSTDHRERSDLYVLIIGPVFDEMVDKIIYTYKFTSLPNIPNLRDECRVWLTTVIDKYDVNKGHRAFSYFSVITKNWFIHKVKKTAQQNRRMVQYDEMPKDLEQKYVSSDEDTYEGIRERGEFWKALDQELKCWDDDTLKENEKKVLHAIKILLKNIDDIEIFNKKAFYLYLRELTGLNTKQVVNGLNRLRSKYSSFRQKWNNSDI